MLKNKLATLECAKYLKFHSDYIKELLQESEFFASNITKPSKKYTIEKIIGTITGIIILYKFIKNKL